MNASKSTGPCTTNGIAKSKLNALKHGLTGQTILLPNDDAVAYLALCQKYIAQYQPAGFAEQTIVQQISDTAWTLARCFALTENVYSRGHFTSEAHLLMPDPLLHAAVTAPAVLKKNVASLEAVSRASARLNRALEKFMIRLEAMQKERRAHEQQELAIAAAMRAHFKTIEKSFVPKEQGFVFTVEFIDAHIERKFWIEASLRAPKLLPKAA